MPLSPATFSDPPAQAEGDLAWRGVHERLGRNPASVPEGFAARAVNYRFRDGFPEPRVGDTILPWGPATLHSAFTGALGAFVASDPLHGGQRLLVATTGGVWAVPAGGPPVAVPLPDGVTLDAGTFCGFVQAFNVIYLLRGDRLPPLMCESLTAGFTALPDAEPGGLPLPNARFGLYFLGRLLAVQGLDYAWCSDADAPQFHLDSIFKVTEGDGDTLQAIAAWGKDTLVAFKQRRVLLYTGASAGPANATFQNGTDQYGLHCPRAVAVAGRELFWLCERGVASLKLTEHNEEQATSLLLSNDLSDTFGRVNWAAAAATARMIFDDGYLYCALPINGSAVNNAIAVYDCQTEAWAGYDATPAGVVDFLKFPYQGRQRLMYLGTDGCLHLRGEPTDYDDTAVGKTLSGWSFNRTARAAELLTRGYAGQDARGKRYTGLRLSCQTLAPAATLSTVGEAAGDEREVKTLTRSPLISKKYGVANRTADNAGDDQADAGWEDYAVDIPSTGLYLGADTDPAKPQQGIDPDRLQSTTLFVPLAQDAAVLQARLVTTAGRVAVRNALMTGAPVNEAKATT